MMQGGRARAAAVFLLVALGGAGAMVIELAAVRLLAPWFGTSAGVWTNVIAAVLLGLAVGYLVGARLASGARPLERLAVMLGIAGFLGACLPLGTSWIGPFLLPSEVALDEAADLVVWGSLAASLALFLPPAVLLGTVCPLGTQVLQDMQGGAAGRAGGLVLCASTLGSLAGVFGTSHFLVPVLGLRTTFLVAGSALVLAGLAAGILARRAGRSASVAGLIVLAFFFRAEATPVLAPGRVELARAESPYQSLRVVEDRSSEPWLRYLQVNEGFDSFQSVWQPEPGFLPRGFYYNDFALPMWWERREGTWNVLVLGLGAGTVVRVLRGTLPPGVELACTGVELDPWVLTLAREHMGLEEREGTRLVGGLDARVALRGRIGTFDEIVLDCYANQTELPPHLSTEEFFRDLRARLRPGGWLTANLGGFGFDDPVVDALVMTVARAFEESVLVLRVPQSRNFVLFARNGGALPLDEEGRLSSGDERLRALLGPRELPGSWRVFAPDPEREVLSDDRAPLEELELASIREGRQRLLAGGARP
jgi:predicted membrane-bound spermidine synthase